MGLKKYYEEAWQALIKPPPSKFSRSSLSLDQTFHLTRQVIRDDFNIPNSENLKIDGSFYRPIDGLNQEFDIVIYLHTRGGNRLEGLFLTQILLPKMGLVLFDFIGSGFSEGEYITLGCKESRDIGTVIDYIRANYKIKRVLLWGRSMGAVAAILYTANNNDKVSGLLLDSPFSNFRRMIYDIVTTRKNVPTCLIDIVLFFLLKTVKKKTGVNLSKINPIDEIKKITVPCFFLVSHNDLISRPDKVKDIYLNASSKVKEFHLTQGEHNSVRSKQFIIAAVQFILKALADEGK